MHGKSPLDNSWKTAFEGKVQFTHGMGKKLEGTRGRGKDGGEYCGASTIPVLQNGQLALLETPQTRVSEGSVDRFRPRPRCRPG